MEEKSVQCIPAEWSRIVLFFGWGFRHQGQQGNGKTSMKSWIFDDSIIRSGRQNRHKRAAKRDDFTDKIGKNRRWDRGK